MNTAVATARSFERRTVALIGHESAGKSALFRSLTGDALGEENNFRGSTVRVRTARMLGLDADLTDTPGIRIKDDSETTRLAVAQIGEADTVLLVVRGTHAKSETASLLADLGGRLKGQRVALVITFADLAPPELAQMKGEYARSLGIPVVALNGRRITEEDRAALHDALQKAAPLRPQLASLPVLPDIPTVQPRLTAFEHRVWGPWLALSAILAMFAVPIWAAYLLAERLQPVFDSLIINRISQTLAPLAESQPLLHSMLAGSYGLVTLGWYSFLWAFPVVVFMGISVALADETGVKDRITAAVDPWLRVIGLNGRDLVPVLTGFGCNTVAVLQTRACSACTRRACITLIAFGSACSYQIAASMSLFNSAGVPWLFLPYLLILFVAGAIHARLWNRGLTPQASAPLAERAFLQLPTFRGVWWRVRTGLKQFLFKAMPIFLVICAAAALLQHFAVLTALGRAMAPLMTPLGLPAEAAPGLVFSIIRKDGLLVLNQDGGRILAGLATGQLLLLVYLGSTLTACLVTLFTVSREVGPIWAVKLAGRQALTAIVSAVALMFVWRLF